MNRRSATPPAPVVGGEYQMRFPSPLAGVKVKVLRRSPTTGGLTVMVLEPRGAYAIGAELHVAPYELEPLWSWRVMCRVSGGITGQRGPTTLKLNGIEVRYPHQVAAEAGARQARESVSPYAAAYFEYWAEEVKS